MTMRSAAKMSLLALGFVCLNLNATDRTNGDRWQTSIMQQLDSSIDRLQAEESKPPNEVHVETQGEVKSEPTIPSLITLPEKQSQEDLIARLLQEHGLPPGLTSVVAVESAFNPLALSPKGARGLWQLMPATARRYGLRVEADADERIDALKSTHAAAAYMKDLFAQFQDWPLVLAAYNAGEVRVSRAMARTGAHDFWTLRRHGALPDETLEYVPAVLERLESPLPAPEKGSSVSPAASRQQATKAGRVAYATLAVK